MKRYTPQHAIKRKRITTGRIIGFCICLMAAAITLAVGITLAKMVSTAGGSNYAQVAAFIVEASGQADQKLTINYDEVITEVQYPFTVTNQKGGRTSEVSMQYDVTVTLPGVLPDGVTVTLDGKDGTVSEDKTSYTFANIGSFQAGQDKTNSHTLKFTVDPWAVTGTYHFQKIGISVHTEQTN